MGLPDQGRRGGARGPQGDLVRLFDGAGVLAICLGESMAHAGIDRLISADATGDLLPQAIRRRHRPIGPMFQERNDRVDVLQGVEDIPATGNRG
ncbi:hypothetical protein [Fimbriiglobus ruber]|uniref:hypothetical protein n=1 Tax=Fimbriiglobus ruber TaxID=1908690 RepID=UPI00117B7F2D|nr:hypothetical protein [Fimbriiglobus ruber]